MMHEDFVTYEQAVKLKELGFDWITANFYDLENPQEGCNKDGIPQDFNVMALVSLASAPTLAQAQKWLRLVKNIIVNVIIDDDSNDPWSYEVLSNVRDEDGDWVYLIPQWKTNFWSETPEEALSAGIDKTLELLAQKQ